MVRRRPGIRQLRCPNRRLKRSTRHLRSPWHFRLDLNAADCTKIRTMIEKITEGEFGQGDWFPVLIGACAYVTMRKDNSSMSMAEIASVIGCDVHELGRMIARVVDFLNLKMPAFDIVNSFKRAFRNLSSFNDIARDKLDMMLKQGIFLIQCAVKWFLTTGRRPLPLVAAVLVFLAEVNGIEGVKIESVAREVHAAVNTCRKRYKELLEALVKVAQALPWGKDVTTKNAVKNAQFIIHHMELKSMEKPVEKSWNDVNGAGFDLEDVVNDCLRKDVEYGADVNYKENDTRYFELEDRSGSSRSSDGDVDTLKISHECLSMLYEKFSDEARCGKSIGESRKANERKRRRRRFELLTCWDWWNGKSELSKKLLLKQILEKDVGMNALPPSFVQGCIALERRREKIKAAKKRINRIMNLADADASETSNFNFLGKKKRKKQVSEFDWEDFVIETLLLHQVGVEEIEKGHYNTLLDLHVFNSVAAVPRRAR
ncbi:plant-specific TFIIB-related protein PTF2 isoform X2 [Tripterygium wilfordii]|uniref:plant-specific TFIIB-related protein PTF2 isoform X2 n=1 Tax=Tripterygium wilfordii TaxID=458696 RepID=UPI0018F7F288|nr:plant-specific TFIIB-related protein PTF2 isoform X2 [Tripterygium wilfordii]